MVTVMRNCVADSPLWCGRFKPSHVCAPLREQKQVRPYVKYVFRNCSTSGSLERRDDLVEKTQPGWKWRLVISYDGTQYSGWQIQKNYVSIQEKVEDALSKFTRLPRDELKLVGAGRTDAGVHAWGQVNLQDFANSRKLFPRLRISRHLLASVIWNRCTRR